MTADLAKSELKNASTLGVAVNLASQIARFVLRFGYQIALARMLAPGDFGLVAMTAPVLAFVQLFADLGLSQATIQQPSISRRQLDCLFWLNVAAAVCLAGLCVLIAPFVANFYGDQRVRGIMLVSGGLLLMSALYSQHIAVLNRTMRFRTIALLDLGGMVAGSLAGIAAALLGAGYWAIMIAQAVTMAAAMVIAWGATAWVPGLPGDWPSVWPMLRFGGNITGFNLVKFVSRNSDNVLIGRFCGGPALGLYDRAFKLMLLPFEQVAAPFEKVAIPMLSRSTDQPEFYRAGYRKLLQAVLLLLYPGLVCMIATSHDLVVLALGRQWEAVAPIFALLGIDAFVAPVGTSMGWLFISQGRTREMRDWGVLASFIFVACFVAGLSWGPEGVAAGYAAAGLIEISYLIPVVTRRGPVQYRTVMGLLLPFLLASAVTFGGILLLQTAVPAGLVYVLAAGVLCYPCFIAVLALTPGGRTMLLGIARQVLDLLARFRRRGGRVAAASA